MLTYLVVNVLNSLKYPWARSGVTGYQFPPDMSSPRNWSPRTGGPPLGFQFPPANPCGRTPVLVREFCEKSAGAGNVVAFQM